MESGSFEALPLHDAVLGAIESDWKTKRLRLRLSALAANVGDAIPHVLTFEGVTLFSMSHSEPWGPSSCVNAMSSEGGRFRVEMQSGDILEIEATSYSFSAL
jgi:hypothetical protein